MGVWAWKISLLWMPHHNSSGLHHAAGDNPEQLRHPITDRDVGPGYPEPPHTMDAQLEKLIDLALADGQLTDKERQVLTRKALELGVDQDEFEMVLDAKLHLAQRAATPVASPVPDQERPRSQKEGDVRKCPACGSSIQSFATKCSDCGHEFRNTESTHSVQKLADMLNAVQVDTPQASGVMGMFTQGSARILGNNRASDKRKEIIRNFPIPNTREDLLEFMAMAVPNCKKPPLLQRGTFEGAERTEMADVWKAKCEQIVMKARFSMKNDPATLAEIEHYAKSIGI